MIPARPGAAASLAPLLCVLLLGTGCLPVQVTGNRLDRRSSVPLQVHILSEPAGALVRDLDSGRLLGRTPLVTQPFALVFEEWSVVNDDETLRTLARPGDREGHLAVTWEGGKEPRVTEGEPVVLRYLLALDGYEERELTWTLDPKTLPELAEEPAVTLVVHLRRAGSPPPSGR